MRAEDFITKVLNMEIERVRSGAAVAMRTYRDGRVTFVVPKRDDISSDKIDRLLWHEVGHYFDKAHAYGGRSQATSWAQSGKYSNQYQDLLARYQAYVQQERPPVELTVRFNYKGKVFRDVDVLTADPDVPESFKFQCLRKVNLWQYQQERYLTQSIELFADGFATYVQHPEQMKQKAPELYQIYSEIFAKHPELQKVHTKDTTRQAPDTIYSPTSYTRYTAGMLPRAAQRGPRRGLSSLGKSR